MTERIKCGGLIERADLCLVEIQGYAWRAQHSCGILSKFADAGIALAFLNISHCGGHRKTMSICLSNVRAAQVPALVEQVAVEFEPEHIRVEQDIAIITLYGPHFYERVALASEVYSCLCMAGIEAQAVGSSINSISLVVHAAESRKTREVLAERFEWPE